MKLQAWLIVGVATLSCIPLHQVVSQEEKETCVSAIGQCVPKGKCIGRERRRADCSGGLVCCNAAKGKKRIRTKGKKTNNANTNGKEENDEVQTKVNIKRKNIKHNGSPNVSTKEANDLPKMRKKIKGCSKKTKKKCLKKGGTCKSICLGIEEVISKGCKGKTCFCCTTNEKRCSKAMKKKCTKQSGTCKTACSTSEKSIPEGCKGSACICCVKSVGVNITGEIGGSIDIGGISIGGSAGGSVGGGTVVEGGIGGSIDIGGISIGGSAAGSVDDDKDVDGAVDGSVDVGEINLDGSAAGSVGGGTVVEGAANGSIGVGEIEIGGNIGGGSAGGFINIGGITIGGSLSGEKEPSDKNPEQ